jgi:cytochrome bd ubiquinol oxidase subunit II
MGTVWFCLIAATLLVYILLDGFDLGAGTIHLLVAKTDAERQQVLASIGPVYDGNEVWLIAAGGTLFLAFPVLYASAFSGFYLPLMIVLWLLILRGISIEFRNHIQSAVWIPFWDVVFSASSLLLAVFFGAALGNVVRGVPLDASGYFFEPLWTDFRATGIVGILDWYTILVGVLVLFALALHGALWVRLKTSGAVNERCLALARKTWPIVSILTVAVTAGTFVVQPSLRANLMDRPWQLIFRLLAITGLVAIRVLVVRADERRPFFASCAYLAGMFLSVVAGVYPTVLPSQNPAYSLTISNAKAGAYGLRIGLIWWLFGISLTTGYFILVYRLFGGKVASGGEAHGHSR